MKKCDESELAAKLLLWRNWEVTFDRMRRSLDPVTF